MSYKIAAKVAAAEAAGSSSGDNAIIFILQIYKFVILL